MSLQDDLYSIKEASELTGVKEHTLRFWERKFNSHLSPTRTAGGQRRYSRSEIEKVFRIKQLVKQEMYSIAGALRVLLLEEEGEKRLRGG